MGDWYWKKKVDLIEAVIRDVIIFHKILANSQRPEEFPKEFSSLAEKFTFKWKEKEWAQNRIFPTIPNKKLVKGLMYKKKVVDGVRIPVGKLFKQKKRMQIKKSENVFLKKLE